MIVSGAASSIDSIVCQIGEWYNEGKMTYKENLIEGFNNIPTAFIGLFKGENIGKQMVKVAGVDDD